ncbi:hypothetical protein [Nonomuraea sp. NPDC049480]|uniref:hypothetical protein n=1 Tax=Nonomuraea sp. NPDC049480 TaxID=3364353 RepID=UPI0037B0DB02
MTRQPVRGGGSSLTCGPRAISVLGLRSPAGLAQTVTTIYRLLVETLDREPRVLPAMLAGLGQ